MRKPDPRDHIPLSPYDFEILLALLVTPRHGYSIIREIERRTGGEVVLGTSTLYAAVQRLVKSGLLEESEPPPEHISPDERRRYYRATAFGREVASLEAARIRRLEKRLLTSPVRDLQPGPGAVE